MTGYGHVCLQTRGSFQMDLPARCSIRLLRWMAQPITIPPFFRSFPMIGKIRRNIFQRLEDPPVKAGGFCGEIES
jgi:hypothetical protein